VDLKSMNIVCAGKDVFDSGELFSEVELMNFISYLARTPMVAGLNATGQIIYKWLESMYRKNENSISFDRKTFYHCRSRKAEEMPYTSEEMLRAPFGLSGAGRFNQVGRSHFYFSDTQNGAETEVKKHLKKEEVLQTVMLEPVKSIKLLDLSHTLRRGSTFFRMIKYQVSDANNKMPREYLLPCYVADCCKAIGWEGIKYYGSKEYRNYVTANKAA
jgi:hypothetical protein